MIMQQALRAKQGITYLATHPKHTHGSAMRPEARRQEGGPAASRTASGTEHELH
jgi:hypothetical protein